MAITIKNSDKRKVHKGPSYTKYMARLSREQCVTLARSDVVRAECAWDFVYFTFKDGKVQMETLYA